MTAWPAISSRSGLALALLLGALGCGDREGNQGRPAAESPPALGSVTEGIGPYTFALPPMPAGTVARAGGEPPAPDEPAAWVSPPSRRSREDPGAP